MSNESRLLEEEIDGYITNVNQWSSEVKALSVAESQKGVVNRFVRDCETLVKDLTETDTPSSSDLVDFQDRHNSLEVQYNTLTDNN